MGKLLSIRSRSRTRQAASAIFLGALLIAPSARSAAGNLDPAFDPGAGADNNVHVVAVQPDGRILLGGQFMSFGGGTRNRLARVLADGSLDASFDPGAGANDTIRAILVQEDGSLLVGGKFSSFGGGAAGRLVRVESDGTRDWTFNAGNAGFNSGTVECVIRLSSGKLLVGGSFTRYDNVTANRVARLNADGSLDQTFAVGAGANNPVNDAIELPDGRIVIVGAFGSVDGNTYGRVACLNPDGSVDTTFVNPAASGTVHSLALQNNGEKIVIGGTFARVGSSGHVSLKVARLNLDGTVDTTFQNPGFNSDVHHLAVQPDNRVLVGGVFSTLSGQPHSRLVRLTADGAVDSGFVTGSGANGTVRAFALDAIRYWIVGGDFDSYDGTTRNRLMRLEGDNVPPSFDLMASHTTAEDSGPQVVPGFVTNVSPGPADEASQQVTFSTVVTDPSFFAVVPMIQADGSMTYTPAADVAGTTTVTVTATDDGLVPASSSQEFTVTLTPVDDAPFISLPSAPAEFNAEGPPVLIDPGTLLSDVDGTDFHGGSIHITNWPAGFAGDNFNIENQGDGPGEIGVTNRLLYYEGINVGYLQHRGNTGQNGKALDLLFNTASATTVAAEAALRRLSFENTQTVPPAAQREIHITVTDPDGLPAKATNYVNIPGVGVIINSGPTNDTVLSGSTVNLTVVAEGTPPLTYRWMRNGVEVPGGNSATLTVSPVSLADAGDYTVEVSNAGGSETSSPAATLTVLRNTAPDFAFVGGEDAITNLIAWGDNSAGQTNVPAGLLNPAYLAGGGAHSIVIQHGWTGVGWGDNTYGQTAFPHDLDVVWWIAGGENHSLLVHGNDGQIAAFGDNSFGQATVPTGIGNAYAVHAGANHSLARLLDGTLVAWGDNAFGQTDVPSIEIQPPPGGPPPIPRSWQVAAAGERHSVGYHTGGEVLAWGDNTFGQTDVPAAANSGVRAIVAGGHHNLLLKTDGTLIAWGDLTEIPAGLAGEVQMIAAGKNFNLALKTDGTVIAWGDNTHGQTDVPPGLSNVVQIAAGDRHALAIYTTRAPGPVLSTVEDSGAYSLDPFIVNITKGSQAIEDGQSLTFFVSSDNAGLFASGPDISPAGVLTFTPAPDAHGSANVTVRLGDDGGTADGGVDVSGPQTFTITVVTVNDAPVVTLAAGDIPLLEDSGPYGSNGFASFSPGPADESGQSLIGYAVTANPAAMFSVQPSLNLAGDLTFTPAPDANGVATITVVAQDDGGTVNNGVDRGTNTFTITITPVNDAPAFSLNAGPVVLIEGAGSQTLASFASGIAGGPANESGQGISFIVNNDNSGLFTVPPQIDGSGTLTFTPVAVGGGAANVSVQAMDDGGVANGGVDTSAAQAFVIEIGQLNRPPTFDLPAEHAVLEDAPLQTVAGFASNISPGPPADAGQTVTFAVAADAPSLFATAPAIAADGTLTYQPAPDAFGSSVITAVATDDGPLVAGRSPATTNTFTIRIEGVNEAPSFTMNIAVGPQVVGWGRREFAVPPPEVASGVVDIDAVVDHSLALKNDGTVVAWGDNTYGQSTVPAGLNNVIAIAAEQTYSMALKNDGTVITWGQIGFGAMPAEFAGLVAIDAGFEHALGLKDDGTVVAWGGPTPPTGLSNVVAIAAGVVHDVALKGDGTVVAWGSGGFDLLNVPPEATNVIAIAAADYHTLALKSDGTVVAWGTGSEGQEIVPAGLSDVIAIDVGPQTSVALRSDGTVVAWGWNNAGQTTVPPGLEGIVDVAAGYQHTIALRGADTISVDEDAPPQSIAGFITGIQPGSAPEAAQVVQFNVTNDNAALFAAAPAIDSLGTLTFTLAPNAVGSAEVTIAAQDDGGTANGGADTSAPQQFTISVAAVNDPPALVLQSLPADIAFFAHQGYVTPDQIESGLTLFDNLGVRVTPFGYFSNVVGVADVIIVPTRWEVFGDSLDAATIAGLSNHVHQGGGLLTMGNLAGEVYVDVLFNTVFGYALQPDPNLRPSVPTLDVLGTPYADDPELLWAGQIQGWSKQSLPPNAVVMYEEDVPGTPPGDPFRRASVVEFFVGAGRAVFLGADFQQTSLWSGEGSWAPVLLSALSPGNANIEVLENHGRMTVSGFAGPTTSGGESGQAITYLVANDNNALFSVQPTIAANGDLTFTTAPSASGTATITVQAMDDGGTENGGSDTSAEQTFTITVNPVNDAPSFALMPAGRVVAWGANWGGQTNVPPEAMSGVTDVAAGWFHSLALKDDGSVVAWGANPRGEASVPPAAQSGVVAIAGGLEFSLALKEDGTVIGWGENGGGESPPPGLSDVTAIAAGDNFGLALKNDGTVVGWGWNGSGQIDIPAGLSDVVAIAAGGGSSLALKSDGTVVNWGFDWGGFAGGNYIAVDALDERTLTLTSAGTVAGFWWNADPETNAMAIAVGADHALALRHDGTVVMSGGLFDDAGDVPPLAQSGVIAIAAGESHSLALLRGLTPQLSVPEDAGRQFITNAAIDISVGPPSESAQVLHFNVSNDNPALFRLPPSMTADGTLHFETLPDLTGSAVITVIAEDDGGTTDGGSDTSPSQSFTLEILPVNDRPQLGLQMLPDTVAVFHDSTDGWTQFDSASNRFQELGVSVSSFTDFDQVAGVVDVIVIPALREALTPNLAASTIQALSNHVHHGGTLVTMGNAAIFDDVLLNTLFDYSLVPSRNNRSAVRTEASVGTAFADDPDRLWGVMFMQGWERDSLPADARVIYEEDRTEVPPGDPTRRASVVVFPVGTGQAVFLAGNFYLDTWWTGEYSWSPVLASATTPVNLNVEVPRNHGAMTVTGFAAPTTAGATNENGQSLTFLLSNDNQALFASQPVIASDGELSFSTAPDASGTATVTVQAMDDGGTANGGHDLSAEETFTITIQSTRIFFSGSPSARPGFASTATIAADVSGAENALGFTLNFDPSVLAFTGAALNADMSGLSPFLSVNDSAAANGRVGIALALPAGTTFPGPSSGQLIDVTFNVATNAAPGPQNLIFTDELTPREVTDINALVMPHIGYVDGAIAVMLGTHEGDVTPRPFGDGALTITDAIQIGRFVTGLDNPDAGEFQRADSAPLATGGDGRLSVADWAQALRFAAGLDPVPEVAGPIGVAPAPSSLSLNDRRTATSLTPREVRLEGQLSHGRRSVVAVVLDGRGDEAGIGLTLGFDPSVLSLDSASLATELSGATLLLNQQRIAEGRLGLIVAMPPGQSFAVGRQTLAEVAFLVSPGAAFETTVAMLADGPVVAELSDTSAIAVPASFNGSVFPIQLPPGYVGLGVSTDADGRMKMVFGTADGSPVTAAEMTLLEVQATSQLIGGTWVRLDNALELVNGQVHVHDPDAAQHDTRFYRVTVTATRSAN